MFVLRKMAVKARNAPYNGMFRGFAVPAHERYELVVVWKGRSPVNTGQYVILVICQNLSEFCQ
jgi:hypothetical protein